MHIPPDIRARLAAEAGRDPRTVEAVLEGRGSDQARIAVYAAARRLGITLPLPPDSGASGVARGERGADVPGTKRGA